MMTWNEYLDYLTRSISAIALFMVLLPFYSYSQSSQQVNFASNLNLSSNSFFQTEADTSGQKFPPPKKVMKQSLMIPGWGQVTNKQIWKVPIVYGLLGGLTYYSITLHNNYQDYRAAYYNLNPNTPNDQRFGPTPGYISENSNLNSLRENRNFYRNRRDLSFVIIGLAYALNVIDAYVYAHLRPFDVSDDLSMKTEIKPEIIASSAYSSPVPSVKITINF